MKIDLSLKPTRPKAPKREENVKSPVDDYYLKMQVSSMLVVYAGKGRKLEVVLAKTEFERFHVLKKIFGDGFGLNEIVSFASHLLSRTPALIQTVDLSLAKKDGTATKFKPSEGALTAIVKCGEDDAASKLAVLGINALYEMWVKDLPIE